MVEGAIVLGVTALLIFGALDLALAVTRYNALADGARRAARRAMVHGSAASRLGPLGPTTMEFAADAANPIAAAAREILPAMDPQHVQVRVEWPDASNRYDDRVRVTLRYTHRSFVPLLLGYGNLDLQATSCMAVAH
jgi:Flp pilus assembly protein TadG